MAGYKTGRSRTRTWSGDWGGTATWDYISTVPGRWNDCGISSYFSLEVGVGAVRLQVGTGRIIGAGDDVGTISVTGQIGSLPQQSDYAEVMPDRTASSSPPDFATVTKAFVGTWQISYDTDEWATPAELSYPNEGTAMPPDGYVIDFPRTTELAVEDRCRPGGSIHYEATIGGATISQTVTIDTADAAPRSVGITRSAVAQAQKPDSIGWATVSTPPLPNPAYHYSNASGEVDGPSGTARAIGDPNYGGPEHTSGLSTTGYEDRKFDLSAILRSFADTYPNSVEALINDKAGHTERVTLSGGSGSHSAVQQRYSIHGAVYGLTGPSIDVNEWCPVSVSLDPDSLEAVGDDRRDTRVMMRGYSFQGVTIGQVDHFLVDDMQSGWESVANCTLTPTGTALHVVVSGAGAGEIKRTYSPGKALSGYRLLRLVGMKGLTIQITTDTGEVKRWGMGYDDGYIDLCVPDSRTAELDAKTSPHTWQTIQTDPTHWHYSPEDTDYWGVSNVREIRVSGLTAGATYDFGALELWRSDVINWPATYMPQSMLCLLPGFDAQELAFEQTRQSSTETTDTYYYPFALGMTQGRCSLYERIGAVQFVIGEYAAWFNAYPASIADLAGWLNTADVADIADASRSGYRPGGFNPGWSGSAMVAPTTHDPALLKDDYLNRERPAAWLAGGGAYWGKQGSETEPGWHYYVDSIVSDGMAYPAEMLIDRVTDWPSDCGDLFDHGYGATPDALQLRAAKYLRGRACGLVIGEDGLPVTDKAVTVKRASDDQDGGDASSETAGGEYRTGTPYAHGNAGYKIACQQAATATMHNRYSQRVVFTTITRALNCLCVDSIRSWLHIGDGKRIRTYDLAEMALNWSGQVHPVDSWVGMRVDPRRGCLLLLGRAGGDLVVRNSYDGGDTGTEVTRVTAKTGMVEVDSERGVHVLIWSDNSDAIWRRESTDGGATWTADAPANLAGGGQLSGQVLSITRDPRYGSMQLLLGGASGAVYRSQDLGATWTQVLT